MAITNQERVGKAMDLLRAGLSPFIEREFKSQHRTRATEEARRYFGDDRTVGTKPIAEWDVAALLKLMWQAWPLASRNSPARGRHQPAAAFHVTSSTCKAHPPVYADAWYFSAKSIGTA